jgi:hypothetical protein
VRIPGLKANAASARQLRIALRQVAGVESVEINLFTGSVLFYNDAEDATIDLLPGCSVFGRCVLIAPGRWAKS